MGDMTKLVHNHQRRWSQMFWHLCCGARGGGGVESEGGGSGSEETVEPGDLCWTPLAVTFSIQHPLSTHNPPLSMTAPTPTILQPGPHNRRLYGVDQIIEPRRDVQESCFAQGGRGGCEPPTRQFPVYTDFTHYWAFNRMGTGTAHISSPYSPLGKTSLLVSDETTLKIIPLAFPNCRSRCLVNPIFTSILASLNSYS